MQYVRFPKCDVKLNYKVNVSTDSTASSKKENEVVDPFPTIEEIQQYKPTREQMKIAKRGEECVTKYGIHISSKNKFPEPT